MSDHVLVSPLDHAVREAVDRGASSRPDADQLTADEADVLALLDRIGFPSFDAIPVADGFTLSTVSPVS
jgi:hypothetical protein